MTSMANPKHSKSSATQPVDLEESRVYLNRERQPIYIDYSTKLGEKPRKPSEDPPAESERRARNDLSPAKALLASTRLRRRNQSGC